MMILLALALAYYNMKLLNCEYPPHHTTTTKKEQREEKRDEQQKIITSVVHLTYHKKKY